MLEWICKKKKKKKKSIKKGKKGVKKKEKKKRNLNGLKIILCHGYINIYVNIIQIDNSDSLQASIHMAQDHYIG